MMSTERNAFDELSHAYSTAGPNSFGLFLGAGVNLPTGDVPVKFKTYTWPQLLEELYQKNADRYDQTFEELMTTYGENWPDLAEALIGNLPPEIASEQLDQIVYDKDLPRSDRRARLSEELLKQTPNLHAAISFSTQIKRHLKSWRFQRNPKIGAIITTNYDFFFGAGWTRYEAFKRQWKIRTPSNSDRPIEDGGIYYIHGYLPYRMRKKRELVLTKKSYDEYYAPGAFARKVLMQVVEKYQLLFIGFSFADNMVCDLLQEMRARVDRQHFAFTDEKAGARAEALGIIPIVVTDWGEIARDLKKIYCASIPASSWQSFGFDSVDAYWERLKVGPQ